MLVALQRGDLVEQWIGLFSCRKAEFEEETQGSAMFIVRLRQHKDHCEISWVFLCYM